MNAEDRSRAQAALEQARKALSMKRTAEARALAARAVALDPDLEDAWLILAAFSAPRDSIRYLKRVLEINPNNERARQGLQWAEQRLASQPPDTAAEITTPVPLQDTARVHTASSFVPPPAAAQAVPTAPPATPVEPGSTRPVTVRRHTPARTRRSSASLWLAAALVVVLGGLLLFVTPLSNLVKAYYSSQPRPVGVLYKPSLTATSTATLTPTATATPTFTQTQPPTATYTATPIPSKTPKPTRTRRPMATDRPTPPPTVEPIDEEIPPPFAGEGNWVDVNLTDQTAAAYEGDELVRSFVVSTGTYQHPTVTGQYYIYVKYRYADMRGPGYYLPDVPYVMYFYKGYGLHGTYWHNNFGTPMSHGCVNFSIDDAAWLFDFTSVGTLVNVHY